MHACMHAWWRSVLQPQPEPPEPAHLVRNNIQITILNAHVVGAVGVGLQAQACRAACVGTQAGWGRRAGATLQEDAMSLS